MYFCCRAPYGARGLKWQRYGHGHAHYGGRAPYGARGLKSAGRPGRRGPQGRAPYGARGLKSLSDDTILARF